MLKKTYELLDLSEKRYVYAVGDIHGCFDQLDAKLRALDFSPKKDFLVSLGDLVDRGPYSEASIKWIKQPWFKHIVGNHEEMALQHSQDTSAAWHHNLNGGSWFSNLDATEKDLYVDYLMDAPYLLEVITPNKLKVGFVHADLLWSTWQENIEAPDYKTFTWSRQGIKNLCEPDYDPSVKGIDHVYFGHNALKRPYTRGNCTWLDTGAGFADGYISVVNIDA